MTPEQLKTWKESAVASTFDFPEGVKSLSECSREELLSVIGFLDAEHRSQLEIAKSSSRLLGRLEERAKL